MLVSPLVSAVHYWSVYGKCALMQKHFRVMLKYQTAMAHGCRNTTFTHGSMQ